MKEKGIKRFLPSIAVAVVMLIAIIWFVVKGLDPDEESVNQTGTETAQDASGAEQSVAGSSQGEGQADNDALKKMAPKPDITIVYTNDVHTYIDNKKVDSDGTEHKLLNYGSVAAIRKDHINAGETVFLVDAGDNVQGNAYGGFDKGQGVTEIMLAAGYDVSAVGNHEFDYGMDRAMRIFNDSGYPYVSCNFSFAKSGECVLPAYEIVERNGVKVAFIGVTTPESYTKSSPMYFEDETGEIIYDFCQSDDGQKLYDRVQQTVDEVKGNVDYVIALTHLGIEDGSAPFRSTDVIAHTRGIDAVIDGHSHSVVESMEIPNADGKKITLTQTGCYLNTIGVMKISDGQVSTELIAEYDEIDEKAIARTEIVIDAVNDELDDIIAVNDNTLYINDAMDNNYRLVRRMNTNITDLVTDSIYWLFNEDWDMDCDIAIYNGGGIRSSIEVGDFSYLSAAKILPFGNVVCMVRVKGQDIKDMLEWSTRNVGVEEAGGLLHVAGARFTVDTSIENTCSGDDKGVFISGPTGEYRVRDIQIYNKDKGDYEDLDLDKEYTIGGSNYLLRNGGEGFTMLTDAELIIDYVTEDYLALSDYVKEFKTAEDGLPHINNAASPLSTYKNYMYNYESPMGAGRMQIIAQ